MANKDQVISNFRRQTGKYTHGSKGRTEQYNLWYDKRVLYSFGTHFPLALRYHSKKDIPENSEGFGCGIQYIVNGDKYSSSTSSHQRECIRSLKRNVQIPFSALQEAWNYQLPRDVYYKEWGQWHTREEALADAAATGKPLWDEWGYMTNPEWVNRPNALAEKLLDGSGGFKIVAYRKDTWEYRGADIDDKPIGDWISSEAHAEHLMAGGDCGHYHHQSRHRLGGVLFTIWGTSFLSSFDEQDRTNYFLCQVPGSPTTIEEAYEALVPDAVKALPSRENVLRQGDWFFLPVAEDKDVLRAIKSNAKTEQRDFRLGGSDGTHKVTRARVLTVDQLTFVKGTVRHSPTDGRRPEHRRLKLGDGKQWYVPVKNTSEAGWGAVGNVD